MTYRPSIDSEVHERVQLHMIGKDGSANEIYMDAVKACIDEDGEEHEWFKRLQSYAEENDEEIGDVLDKIVTMVMDESGEPEVRFKSSIGL